jgi:hypothetical protein
LGIVIVQRIIQFLFLAVTYPIWWPIAKLMYREIQGALMYEGGLFGSEPTEKQLKQLRETYGGDYESPMVSIPWARAREAREAELEARRNRGRKITASDEKPGAQSGRTARGGGGLRASSAGNSRRF